MTSYCNTHCGESLYLLESNIPAVVSPPHYDTQIIHTDISQPYYPWTNDKFSNPKELPSAKKSHRPQEPESGEPFCRHKRGGWVTTRSEGGDYPSSDSCQIKYTAVFRGIFGFFFRGIGKICIYLVYGFLRNL
jgi:hypothetical protein